MKSDSATNVKNKFSAYLDMVKAGETVLILEYGRPVAQISKPSTFSALEPNFAKLEREGLISIPSKGNLNPKKFLAKRIKLAGKNSLSDTLLKDREESF